jgi:hypothetical protein
MTSMNPALATLMNVTRWESPEQTSGRPSPKSTHGDAAGHVSVAEACAFGTFAERENSLEQGNKQGLLLKAF